MAQHNLEGCNLSWTRNVNNCFLIRDPEEVIHSYGKRFHIENEFLLGFVQQAELFRDILDQTGIASPVLDAKDILTNPQNILEKLCAVIGIDFTKDMLSWPAGPRESDGIWAPY